MSDGDASLIGLDWGTTSLRAYLIGAAGEVLDSRAGPQGITNVADGDFEGALLALAGDLLTANPAAPILASGMIGARQGWVECPYVACPAGLPDLAERLTGHTLAGGRDILFAPGVNCWDDDGTVDVIRGEETQIMGACAGDQHQDSELFVLPGTHSKWVRVVDGQIDSFATYMSGEVFQALCDHTILGRMMSERCHRPAAFARGLDYGWLERAGRGGLVRRLFSARSLCLFDALTEAETFSYLSGLLIANEIREALDGFVGGGPARPIVIVGSSELSERYATALRHFGLQASAAPPEATALGQWRLAAAAQLVD